MQECLINGNTRITEYSYADSLKSLATAIEEGFTLALDNNSFPSCFMGHYEFEVTPPAEEQGNGSEETTTKAKANVAAKQPSRKSPSKLKTD